MRSESRHKVCFEVKGVPSIIRAIDGYHSAGIESFCLVLGTMAGDVISCVGERYDNVAFAYQKEALGTANAVSRGVEALRATGFRGRIMIGMGDKIISPKLVSKLLSRYDRGDVEMVMASQDRTYNRHGGRVVRDTDGSVLGIVEEKDVNSAAEAGQLIDVGGRQVSPQAVEQGGTVNAALYLLEFDTLTEALSRLEASSVTGEFYLTDIVQVLSERARKLGSGGVAVVHSSDASEVLGFNTVDELLRVEQMIDQPLHTEPTNKPDLKSAKQWIELFRRDSPDLDRYLASIYGSDPGFLTDRRKAYLSLLEAFVERYDATRPVVLARAPGRVNLMGRHVEHRGGNINVISINREIICAAAPRSDDVVELSSLQPGFGSTSFSVGDFLSMLDWQEWIDFVDSGDVQRLVLESKGHWENYVKAAVLRLQHRFPEQKLGGMDMVFDGNIPIAAGLSSSSAVVVATAEAAIAVNDLVVSPQDFVDLCGEGEWFVGSRGGAGDHAAMKFGTRGSVSQIGFFPFEFRRSIPFPEEYRLVIADSHVKASKATNAKDLFNQRIAEYEYALDLFRHYNPAATTAVHRIRDIAPETMSVPPSRLYELIRNVPEHLTLSDIEATFPKEYGSRIARLSSSHTVPDRYAIRPVLLYGIAECRRSRLAADLLEQKRIEDFGRMMAVSHDGDRIVRWQDTAPKPYKSRDSDQYLDSLIADLRSEDPARVAAAQIENQPGGYACSTRETDLLVDLARSVAGVAGAQLSGAGLGGCVMILVHESSLERLIETLETRYYEQRDIEPSATACLPVQGSMVLDL